MIIILELVQITLMTDLQQRCTYMATKVLKPKKLKAITIMFNNKAIFYSIV